MDRHGGEVRNASESPKPTLVDECGDFPTSQPHWDCVSALTTTKSTARLTSPAGAIGMPAAVNVTGQGVVDLAWFQFIGLSFFAGIGGGIVAGFLRNRPGGFRTFNIIAIVVLVISMIGPIAQPEEVAWSTRIVLMITHVLVYITVVKAIQREMANAG